jgi:hypothetical protein
VGVSYGKEVGFAGDSENQLRRLCFHKLPSGIVLYAANGHPPLTHVKTVSGGLT